MASPHVPAQALPKPSRRRDKPQLSCHTCRRKKLRCDRMKPCTNCSRRGLSQSCNYATLDNEVTNATRNARLASPISPMQNRIDDLERKVRSLMGIVSMREPSHHERLAFEANEPAERLINRSKEETYCTLDPLSENFGHLSLAEDETAYVGNSHWRALLCDIADLRDHIDRAPSSETPEQSSLGASELLFGPQEYASRRDILACIPPRSVVDQFVENYFSLMLIGHVVIHRPTFSKEYEQFWTRPEDTSIIWIGLLFGMMCVGMQRSGRVPLVAEPYSQSVLSAQDLMALYRERLVQCLTLGAYMKGPPYTIEALLHLLHREYLQSDDTRMDIWMLLGTILRLALRMGYHRDGSHSPRLSLFKAEMRRRVWAVLSELDVNVSAQFGLPRMIDPKQSDTAVPRNLRDEDLSDDMEELPPSRPDEEHSPIQFLVAKNRLLSVSARILELTSSPRSPSYAEILQLDQRLQETYRGLPMCLQAQSSPWAEEETRVFLRRIFLALVYQRARCVLHRKYLSTTDVPYSNSSCIDAALQMLQYQAQLHQESLPGGCLHQKWQVPSLMKQDFLFATIVLVVWSNHRLLGSHNHVIDPVLGNQALEALRVSHKIWLHWSKSSNEARKAAEVTKAVLEKIEQRSGPTSKIYGEDEGTAFVVGDITSSVLSDGSSTIDKNMDLFSGTAPSSFESTFLGDSTNTELPEDTPFTLAGDPLDMDFINVSNPTETLDELLHWSGTFDFPL